MPASRRRRALASVRPSAQSARIGAQVLGEPQPAACKYNASNLVANEAGIVDPTDDAGIPITCTTPPPN